MPNETPFQVTLLLSVAAFLAIRMYYRLKTGTLHLNLASSRDRKVMSQFLPILGSLFLGLFVWLVNPNWMNWFALDLPNWARWSGAAAVVVALALLTWVHQTLSANFSGNLEIRERHKLVTSGPYRRVRHPMYSAIVLWATGLSLITANWFVGFLPIAFALFFIRRAPDEERMMVEAFGDEYRNYMQRSGRFWPRIGNQRQRQQDEIKPLPHSESFK